MAYGMLDGRSALGLEAASTGGRDSPVTPRRASLIHDIARKLALCLAVIAMPLTSQAAEYTLRFAHLWPESSATNQEVYQAWAAAVAADSNGRIQVQIYPSQTLAKATASYQAVTSRDVDMTATVQGFTAHRFPLTQVIELPGMVPSAVAGSCVLQSLYDEGLISGEYHDTHVLFLFSHGPGHLHTARKLVAQPADLVGLRIRRPTTVVGTLLEALGAKPVGMPTAEIFPSLERAVIDGATLPWEGVHAFRIHELARYHTEVDLYALAFVVTMNKDVYASMPDDLRAVLDKHSGQTWSIRAGQSFDAQDQAGRAVALKNGHTIVTVEGGTQHPAWHEVLAGTTDEYLAELEGQGLPARAVYERARALGSVCASP